MISCTHQAREQGSATKINRPNLVLITTQTEFSSRVQDVIDANLDNKIKTQTDTQSRVANGVSSARVRMEV